MGDSEIVAPATSAETATTGINRRITGGMGGLLMCLHSPMLATDQASLHGRLPPISVARRAVCVRRRKRKH